VALRRRDEVKAFVAQFHVANPGPRGPFYGNPPTGEQGTMSETHAVRLCDGRIVEQFVGDNNFSMPHQELVTWDMDFPRDTPDPSPVPAEAAPEAQPTM
jgi:hypothetical protein